MVRCFLFILLATIWPQAKSIEQSDITVEEYAVVSAYLDTLKVSPEDMTPLKMIVIKDHTHEMGNSCSPDSVAQFHPGIANEQLKPLFSDLRTKSKVSYPLGKLFQIKRDYVLLSRKEISAFFPNDDVDGWKNFYRKYPNSSGILSFSRVGFNTDKTKAIFFKTMSCGFLCASGDYYVLEKVNSTWKVVSVFNCWIS